MTDQLSAPVAPQDRLEVLDVLRGFALCGILLMNIMLMGSSRAGRPALPAVAGSPDWTVWFVQSVGFEGTMRGLFTLLFGTGILLMTRRDGADTADVYFRRCLMLMAFGLANVLVFLFPGDILFMYGVTGLFLFVFRKARPRTLLVLAGVLLLALSAKGIADLRPHALEMREARVLAEAQAAGRILSEAEREKAGNWTRALERQTTESPRAAREREQRTGGWLSVMGWSWTWWTQVVVAGLLIDILVESAAFMLIGMALFKLGVLTGERSWRVYALMAAGGYAVGLPLNIWEAVTDWNNGFRPDVWITGATYQLDRLAMTIGHLGLVLLLWKAGALGRIGQGFRAIGRLGLTNYLGQSAIAAILFYGFGLWDRLGWAQLWGVCVGVWVFQALFSLLYLRRFSIGPAEWLLRSVAYGRRQSMRLALRVAG
ncbi:DUF418 domain-containing protein [Brevundimonas sp.]|uniref:DUF418 domain-containing protein n=1 Tax=Brevundimonas sp. TaxID=1871086 RepID=UPI002D43FDA7|nr:DUF418 domain-containing protein [Brevundimonas sp.]HYC98779.1 DUF418 domain-containing protein [Brevundimonas sp.]